MKFDLDLTWNKMISPKWLSNRLLLSNRLKDFRNFEEFSSSRQTQSKLQFLYSRRLMSTPNPNTSFPNQLIRIIFYLIELILSLFQSLVELEGEHFNLRFHDDIQIWSVWEQCELQDLMLIVKPDVLVDQLSYAVLNWMLNMSYHIWKVRVQMNKEESLTFRQ